MPWVIIIAAAAGCSHSNKTPLVVYSPHGKDMLEEFAQKFEAANPGVDVQWLDMGSQEAYDRIRTEMANPQADVWWGAPSTIFMRAEKEGLLAPTALHGPTASRLNSEVQLIGGTERLSLRR